MSKKKLMITITTVLVAIVAAVGVSYAAWVEFTSKPTDSWTVEANIPTDVKISATVPDGIPYEGQYGGEVDGFFVSYANVTMKATREMSIKGAAVVQLKKDGQDLALPDGAQFTVIFKTTDNAEAPTFALVADAETVVTIGVVFPNLSDTKYQHCEIIIKVNISEFVAAAV